MKRYFVLTLALCYAIGAKANIKLPALIGDHMVLQRDKPISVWGYAKPSEQVTITFANKIYHTITGSNSKWQIKLSPVKAGGPYQMILKGENTITLNDIMMGDVWICSGQSNMEFQLSQVNNAAEEIKNANNPQIRLFSVNKSIDLTPLGDTRGNWAICTSNTAQYFPAIGYLFARDVQRDIKVPIGLINASWGGTVIESWISKEGIADEPTFGEKAREVAAFDTASYNKTHRKLHDDWVDKFNKQDKGFVNDKYIWASNDINTQDWKSINLPTIWGFNGKPDLWEMSGVVWFKKTININNPTGDASLNLGTIQNADRTFVNGVEVGHTPDVWGFKRMYKIPAGLLKQGENTITVRVENYGGDGGFVDEGQDFSLKSADNMINLRDKWQYKIGYTLTNSNRPEKEISPNTLPTLMYNAMISPLVNYGIKGVLWYQGESNWFRAYQYRELFPRMISDWRAKFQQGDFPFLYVQLAGYHRKQKQPEVSSYWAEVREAQDKTLKVKNTGMVTAFDVGDSSNVHPKNKQEVARRLVLLAGKKVYGLPGIAEAPRYKSFEVQGNAIIIKLSNPVVGAATEKKVGGFEIAGADHKFYWASALIINNTQIKVSSILVPHPVAVRYAWEDNPADANVYNSVGLPLFPFRIDNWKGLTDDNK